MCLFLSIRVINIINIKEVSTISGVMERCGGDIKRYEYR
jgi:hypothetical protein